MVTAYHYHIYGKTQFPRDRKTISIISNDDSMHLVRNKLNILSNTMYRNYYSRGYLCKRVLE